MLAITRQADGALGGFQHLDIDAVEVLEASRGDDVLDRPGGGEATVAQQERPAAQHEGLIRMMRRQYDADTAVSKLADLLQQSYLIAEIERGGRFVQDQETRFLRRSG